MPDIPFSMDTFTTLSPIARGGADLPMLLRLVVGLIGLVLLFRGAKTYKPALMLTSFAVGSMTSVTTIWMAMGLFGVPMTSMLVLVGGLIGGLGTMWIAFMMHKMALMTIGATVGAVVGTAFFAIVYAAPPFWAPILGGAVGLITFPVFFPMFLKFFTSAAGAVVVAWALGFPSNILVVGGLWGAGLAAQVMFGGKGGDSGGRSKPQQSAPASDDDGFRSTYRM
jgi:hypothetical protein